MECMSKEWRKDDELGRIDLSMSKELREEEEDGEQADVYLGMKFGACRQLGETNRKVLVAWALALACLGGHLMHIWPGAPRILHVLCSTPVHAATSALAIFGAPHVRLSPSALLKWVHILRKGESEP